MILITGASGKLGSLVLQKLTDQLPQDEQLIASSRHPEKIAHLNEKRVETRQADYADKNSLIRAFRGVRKVFFVSGMAPNEERLQQHKNVVSAAVLAGVRRVCYTSFFNASPSSEFLFAGVHHQTEGMLKNSGLTYTIFRNSWYADLLLEGIDQTLDSGTFKAAAGNARINSIPREEIANAAAKVLMADAFGNATYDMTGPETFSYSEAVAWISEAYGKTVKYVEENPEQIRKLYGGDEPNGYKINGILSSYQAMRAGEYETVSDDFEKIMGRKPQSVREFIQQQAEASKSS